jgi:hypothetical protein
MNTISDAAQPSQPPASLALHARAERILLPGLMLGFAGDYLLRDGPHGLGLLAWLALLAAFALWLARDAGVSRLRTIALTSATALCAALMTALRDLDGLIPAMLLVVLLCAVLMSLASSGISLRAAQVRDYLATTFSLPLQMFTLAPRVLHQANLGKVARNERAPKVVRGIVFAIPVLMVFGVLFAAADAGFSQYLSSITTVISARTLQHLLVVLVFAWLATSLLGIACRAASNSTAAPSSIALLRVGATETHVVLALVSVLFMAFVVLQLGYLFGGTEVITNTSGLTIAEHARRGFFELVVVSALTLAFLYGLSLTDCEPRILRRYGLVLIACVLVILGSALQRLFLYTEAFGLTIERFCALAAIAWLVFNLLAFSTTILRGDIRRFASGIVISGIASLLLLGLANPAAIVTRINLDRSIERKLPLDVHYLLSLGTDAIPPVLARFNALQPSEQCAIAIHIASRYPLVPTGAATDTNEDWRRWNLSRRLARGAVIEHADEVSAAYERFRQAAEEASAQALRQGGGAVMVSC